jgi:carboxypeptidase family protein/TonB-dependent receptor-like protein
MRLRRLFCCLVVILTAATVFAQQTGSISGKVTASDGSALPGVTVEARANVLPQSRLTTTEANGEYRLPTLLPGTYTLQFSLAGMQSVTRKAEVLLGQNTVADAKLGVQGLAESITVTAQSTLVDKTSPAISSALSTEQIQALPVGQQYRDLLKLTPGVQQTPESLRGPSAGGNGQDNVYLFDGVNVTWPQYGTLAAEPSSYDIAQVSVIKGGANAVDFNRSGGFTIDSVSKSGTNKLSGQVGFQVQSHGMTSSQKVGTTTTFQQNQTWGTASLGGPILADRLFFYASYYRPEVTRNNVANVYGPLPQYSSKRNEEFGKLTFTPTSALLINGSYRNSDRKEKAASFATATGALGTATTGVGGKTTLDIGTLEGSWIADPRSYATLKLTNFKNKNHSVPDFPVNVAVSTAVGTHLDINNLEQMGHVFLPLPISGNTDFNNFIAPFIAKYGYLSNGVPVGGGNFGVAGQSANDFDDFSRRSGQVGYNLTLGTTITHDLHAGYQRYTDIEDLTRSSNGWGDISLIGGRTNCPASACGTAKPIFFQASLEQATFGTTPVHSIHSELRSQNIELNDSIHWNNWSFNAGVIASNDTLYGQGLKNDSSAISGYVSAPGNRYKMYNIPFGKMIQPRLGATWAYNGEDTVYVSLARYNPGVTSLPRAAAWDRALTTRTIRAYFDQNGNLIGVDPLRSSSGKLFVPNMDPREIKELLVGTSQQLTSHWSSRLYGRYRKGDHFWEDTNNTARIDYNAPPPIPHEPYIPNLGTVSPPTGFRGQIGSGSSYVIAELDGAFTKYYEATAESEWRGNKTFLRGSYTWSHYYGNFDQDNTTGCPPCNDFLTFIGSSNIADGAGHQLWDNKYGNMHGDRRHLLKLYGTYFLPWNASTGAYAVYQSGQPWEPWDYTVYNKYPDNDTIETIKFAEPAGSRRAPAHYQLDLDYTQNIPVRGLNVQLVADVYNVFNKQTGYAIQPKVHSALFGQPTFYWQPRRLQLAARIQF